MIDFPPLSLLYHKVQIFWEGQKNLKKIEHTK